MKLYPHKVELTCPIEVRFFVFYKEETKMKFLIILYLLHSFNLF